MNRKSEDILASEKRELAEIRKTSNAIRWLECKGHKVQDSHEIRAGLIKDQNEIASRILSKVQECKTPLEQLRLLATIRIN
jgi:hypothetical protein